jgi:hypothetical protein
METYRALDQMIADARRLPAPIEKRDRLIQLLVYLRTETVCDNDRRKKSTDCHQMWKLIQDLMVEVQYKNHFRKPDTFYDPIVQFFGIPKPEEKPLNSKGSRYEPLKKPTIQEIRQQYKDWDVSKLMELLYNDSEKVRSALDRIVLRACLKYLWEESKKSRMHHNNNDLKIIWKFINQFLRRNNLLEKFDDDPMRERIRFFIKGGF